MTEIGWFFAFFLVFSLPLTQSATINWVVTDGDWSTAANWDSGVPGQLDTAVIPAGTTARVTTTEIVSAVDNAGTIEISASSSAILEVASISASIGIWRVNGNGIEAGSGTLKSNNNLALEIYGDLDIKGGFLKGKWNWMGGAREMNQQQLNLGGANGNTFSVPGGLILRNSRLTTYGASVTGITEIHNSDLTLTLSMGGACPAAGFLAVDSTFSLTGPETCIGQTYELRNTTISISSGIMNLVNSKIWPRYMSLSQATLNISGPNTEFDETRMGWSYTGSLDSSTLIFEGLSQTLFLEWFDGLATTSHNNYIFRYMNLNISGTASAFPVPGTRTITFENSTIEFRDPATIPREDVISINSDYRIRFYQGYTEGMNTPPKLLTYQWSGDTKISLEKTNAEMIHDSYVEPPENVLPVMFKCAQVNRCKFFVVGNSKTNRQLSDTQTNDIEMLLKSESLRLRNDLSWTGTGSLRIESTLPSPSDRFFLNLTNDRLIYPDIRIPISGKKLDVRGGGRVESLTCTDSSLFLSVNDGIWGSKLNMTNGAIEADPTVSQNFVVQYDTMVFRTKLNLEPGVILRAQNADLRATTVVINMTNGWDAARMPRLETQQATISSDYRTSFTIYVTDDMLTTPPTQFEKHVYLTSQVDPGYISTNIIGLPSRRQAGSCWWQPRETLQSGVTEYSVYWEDPSTGCHIYDDEIFPPINRPPTPIAPSIPYTPAKKKSGDHLGLILGITLPVFVLVTAGVATLVCLQGRRKGSIYTTKATVIASSQPQPVDHNQASQGNQVQMSYMGASQPYSSNYSTSSGYRP